MEPIRNISAGNRNKWLGASNRGRLQSSGCCPASEKAVASPDGPGLNRKQDRRIWVKGGENLRVPRPKAACIMCSPVSATLVSLRRRLRKNHNFCYCPTGSSFFFLFEVFF